MSGLAKKERAADCFISGVFLSRNTQLLKNAPIVLFFFLLMACRKERSTTNPAAQLTIGADTLRFDTVFTTTGATTQLLKIFNNNDKAIQVASIGLLGGAASPFKINANGTPGPLVENLDIAAGDSAYVFVTVAVPGTAAAKPFVVQDSIAIAYNGNTKWVQLEAYGQNAHFLRKHTITGTEVWNAELPYVLLDTCTIASGAHLTINEGCKIYMHANAPIIVAGQLTVQGEHWNSTRVVFTGDRLDEPYRDLPGSWPGIIFKASSHDNRIQYGVLKNAVQAIAVDASSVPNKLNLSETIIDNAADAGIIASNTNIVAQNLLLSNCGRNIVLQNGGDYTFTQATIASYATLYLPHKQPVLTINNTVDNTAPDLNAVFRNCIFWGESNGMVPEQVVLQKNGTNVKVLFDGVLWPLVDVPDGATVTQPPLTGDPEFVTVDTEENSYDFHLKETSPAGNSGAASGVSLDLDGRPRPVGVPDLGAYEEQ